MRPGIFLMTDASSRGSPQALQAGIPLSDALLTGQTNGRDRWSRCFQSLARLRNEKDRSDGERSPPPPKAHVDFTIAWLEELRQHHPTAAAPHVSGGPDGEVTLVWTFGADYLQVDVVKPDQFDWLLTSPQHQSQQWQNRGEVPVGNWQVQRMLHLAAG